MANIASKQIVGTRDVQEDSCELVFQNEHDPASDILMVLSDGMGGHAGGEIASNLACKTFVRHFVSEATATKPRARLEEALRIANAAIGEKIAAEPDLKGMGCTIVAAVKVDTRLSFISVGDSVVFLFRKGKLSRVNADHSLYGELNEMVQVGKLTQAEADAHPKRNALRAAVMGSPIALVDLEVIDLQPDDLIVLATDGLETLKDAEISKILSKEDRPDMRALCSDLLNAVEAKKRTNQDNTTVIAFRHSIGERTSAAPDNPWWNASGQPQRMRKTQPLVLIGAAAFFLILLVFIVWLVTRDNSVPQMEPEPTQVNTPVTPGPSQSIEGESEPIRRQDQSVTTQDDVDVPGADTTEEQLPKVDDLSPQGNQTETERVVPEADVSVSPNGSVPFGDDVSETPLQQSP